MLSALATSAAVVLFAVMASTIVLEALLLAYLGCLYLCKDDQYQMLVQEHEILVRYYQDELESVQDELQDYRTGKRPRIT